MQLMQTLCYKLQIKRPLTARSLYFNIPLYYLILSFTLLWFCFVFVFSFFGLVWFKFYRQFIGKNKRALK